MHPNKLLIMNSRITIYNEAKSRSLNFEYLDEGNKIKKYIININELSKFDKARILYNHFSAQKLSETYFKEIKRGEKYYNIIEHPNKESSYFFKNINFIEWDHVATIIDNSEIVDISGDDVLESLDISLEEDADTDLNEAKKLIMVLRKNNPLMI